MVGAVPLCRPTKLDLRTTTLTTFKTDNSEGSAFEPEASIPVCRVRQIDHECHLPIIPATQPTELNGTAKVSLPHEFRSPQRIVLCRKLREVSSPALRWATLTARGGDAPVFPVECLYGVLAAPVPHVQRPSVPKL